MSRAEPLVAANSVVGESPVWDYREGVLMWVDILACRVHKTDPKTGVTETIEGDRHVGAVALHGDASYVLAVRNGFAPVAGGQLGPVEEVFTDPGVRMNDGAVDPVGRFLAGTLAYDGSRGQGRLFSRSVDGNVIDVLDGVTVSNGIDWNEDGTLMYYVDSATQAVQVFTYDVSTGIPSEPRRHITIPEQDGIPDGITLDSEECLWVALYGGGLVRRYSPTGETLDEIKVPTPQVTSCTFGGEDLDQLYLTTAGYQLDLGRPENRLAGALFIADPGCVGRKAHLIS